MTTCVPASPGGAPNRRRTLLGRGAGSACGPSDQGPCDRWIDVRARTEAHNPPGSWLASHRTAANATTPELSFQRVARLRAAGSRRGDRHLRRALRSSDRDDPESGRGLPDPLPGGARGSTIPHTVYAWAVLLRYGLAIFLNVSPRTRRSPRRSGATPDPTTSAGPNSRGSGAVSRCRASMHADRPSAAMAGCTSWATVYYLFGRNQLLVQFLNGALGALTVLVIYAIAARLFDRARRALGRPLHGLLPADGLLVGGHVQGSRDPALHRPLHVRGAAPA